MVSENTPSVVHWWGSIQPKTPYCGNVGNSAATTRNALASAPPNARNHQNASTSGATKPRLTAVRMANALEGWTGQDATGETLHRFGRFARDLADAVIGGGGLAALTPPTPVWDSYQSYNSAAGHHIEYVKPDADERWQATV